MPRVIWLPGSRRSRQAVSTDDGVSLPRWPLVVCARLIPRCTDPSGCRGGADGGQSLNGVGHTPRTFTGTARCHAVAAASNDTLVQPSGLIVPPGSKRVRQTVDRAIRARLFLLRQVPTVYTTGSTVVSAYSMSVVPSAFAAVEASVRSLQVLAGRR